MSVPLRKPPNIWALASVTYGAVVVVTILSIIAYYYVSSRHAESRAIDAARLVTVGSVWIPVYAGATVESTGSTQQEGVTESTLNFETKDPADQVLSFYQAALKKGVFRFDTVTKAPGGGTVRSLVHQGKTTVVVTIQTAGEGSRGEIKTIDRSVDKDTRN